MLRTEIEEAIDVVEVLISTLLKAVWAPLRQSAEASADLWKTWANLRRACGDVIDDAEATLQDGTIIDGILNCFELGTESGATYPVMDRVRTTMIEQDPQWLGGIAIKMAGIRFALIQMAIILSKKTFKSRDDIDVAIKSVAAAFEAAEIDAADDLESGTYQALVNLHAATVTDLVERGRPLPRIVHYNFVERFPALWLANRIHWDGRRYQELIDENKPVHPLFMPTKIRALSA